jgi:anti-sigma B factor antagonist/stage II sporulation protein AA (anti-sigma F factor antagonist)
VDGVRAFERANSGILLPESDLDASLYNRGKKPYQQRRLSRGDHVEFSTRRLADVVVAAPLGQINHTSAQQLEQALAPILEDAAAAKTPLVLDFSGVEYISSMGLRVLMVAAKQMRSHNASIAVAALQPVVDEIFEIARFRHVLEVFPSVRDALQKLSAPALAAYDASAR